MVNVNNLRHLAYDNEQEHWVETKEIDLDELQTGKNKAKLYIDIDQPSPGLYKIHIPMTPDNIRLLVEQLQESANTVKKETDSRGRINLGTEHADQTKEVIILD